MTEQQERTAVEAGGRMTRRTALGGFMTAILTSTLVSGAFAQTSGAPAQTSATGRESSGGRPAAATPLARAWHTSTLLRDGRVLMAGGVSSGNRALSSVQIYDAVRDAWTDAAPMGTSRFQHAAALLPDGRVLVTGGLHRGDAPISGGEIYDPGANTWTPAPAMAISRNGHTLTALTDGRLIAAGGCHASPLSSVEVYDPTAAA